MKYIGRAALAVALLVGFYVLAIGTVVAMIALVVEAGVLGASGAVLGKLIIVAVVIAIAVGRGLFTRAKDDAEPGGLPVIEADQPRLWAEVRALADAVGTRPPAEIRLVASVNAAVSEQSRFLGLVPGTRRLFLGVPLLLGLTRDQLRSVVAHELGHYSGRHTALGPVTYRGKEAIARVLGNLGSDSIVGKILRQYGKLYYAVSHTVSRSQELEADEFSARIAGREAASSALADIMPLDAVWDYFLNTYGSLGQSDGRRPDQFLQGFEAVLTSEFARNEMARIRQEGVEPPRSVYDSHPPLSERRAAIDALDAPDVVPGDDPAAPATSLIQDPARTWASLEDLIFSGSGLEPTSWETLSLEHGRARVAWASGQLGGALRAGGLEPTLRSALERLDRDEPVGLVQAEDAERERRFVSSLVADAAVDQLVGKDAAKFVHTWGDESGLVDAAGRSLEPWSPSLVEPGGGQERLALLTSWGVDVDATLPEPSAAAPAEITSAADDQVVGTALLVKSPHGIQLFVTHREIVLRKHDVGDRGAGFKGYWLKQMEDRVLARMAEHSVADLESDDRAVVVPFASITEARLVRPRIGNLKLRITLADGSAKKLVIHPDVHTTGRPFEALAHYLGERYVVEDKQAVS